MSVGVVWDSHEQKCTSYFEEHVDALIEHLQQADLVVGFNIIGFDYTVLRGYSKFGFKGLSLDSVGKATLDAAKSADGLMALQWFKEGRLNLIEAYCRKDVELTRDLFYYALEHSYLLFDRKNEGRMRIPLDWKLEELVNSA